LRYRDLFTEREFTALYAADVFSMSGSYIAKVAVAALVYQQTHSVPYTAIAFAIGFAPYLFTPWLAALADLFPRRRLLIVFDLARAAVVAAIVLPGVPVWAIVALLFLEALFRVPWGAARLALLADVLTEARFPAGNALVTSTRQALQVAGFAVGGFAVALVGPRQSVLLDAATFVLSALIIAGSVGRRPAAWERAGRSRAHATQSQQRRPSTWVSTVEGIRVVAESPQMRRLMLLLGFGPALAVISEGLAVPFADELGGDVNLAGLIMAAPPLGMVIGLWLFGRLDPATQRRLVIPLVLSTGLAVSMVGVAGLNLLMDGIGSAADATLIVCLLFVVGLSLCYLNAVQSEIAAEVPSEFRGRVFGIGNAVLQLSQGLAIVLGGLVAAHTDVAPALIVIALVGTLGLAAVLGVTWGTGRREASVSAREAASAERPPAVDRS
jgi:MFS family permease